VMTIRTTRFPIYLSIWKPYLFKVAVLAGDPLRWISTGGTKYSNSAHIVSLRLSYLWIL
jgi:hypothetical protein